MAEKCLSFDGIDDYVNCGNDNSLRGTAAFTVEAWIYDKGSDTEGYNAIIAKNPKLWTQSDAEWILAARLLSDGRRGIYWAVRNQDNDGGERAMWLGNSSCINQWLYICAIFDNGWLYLYVNNDLKDSKNTGFTGINPGNKNVYIAKKGYLNDYFYGYVDEVRISSKARTTEEISAIWNGGNGVQFEVDANTVALWHLNEGSGSTIYDETDNDNDGTIYGATWADGYDFLTSHPTSSDAGSGLDASALSEVFFSADSGVGLGALAALLAAINTSEVSSGCDRLRAKIESATAGGDMKLPPGGQASIPSRKVSI